MYVYAIIIDKKVNKARDNGPVGEIRPGKKL
jgi:hypothetical protein